MSDVFLYPAIVIACQMLFLWLLSIPLRNVSIVDIGWGIGFVLVAWVASPLLWPHILLMVTAWGIRLAYYLWLRNDGKPEDYRYAAMREKRGSSFVWSSLFIVFGLQGLIMWVVALPIMTAGRFPSLQLSWFSNGLPTAIGLVLWFVGMFFEAVGDWQLWEFKSKPWNEGKVLDSGLWKYTRHPNYFGEFLIWWGHWLVCLGVSNFSEFWWTVISPILISFLLLKVSGVAMLERAMKKRSPEYESYINRTSKFFPCRPKPHSSASVHSNQ